MHCMYDTQYADRDVTKYKYMILLSYPKRLVHTNFSCKISLIKKILYMLIQIINFKDKYYVKNNLCRLFINHNQLYQLQVYTIH